MQSENKEHAYEVAKQIYAGHVYINHENSQYTAVPFGGWGLSGVGYENGEWGIYGFIGLKAVLGVG